jgi:hypothetical protein
LRRLARQPGFIACFVTGIGVAFGGSLTVLIWYVPDIVHYHATAMHLWEFVWFWVGSAIAGAWICLMLSIRWRPEPNWTDRAGCLCGSVFVSVPLTVALEFMVQ